MFSASPAPPSSSNDSNNRASGSNALLPAMTQEPEKALSAPPTFQITPPAQQQQQHYPETFEDAIALDSSPAPSPSDAAAAAMAAAELLSGKCAMEGSLCRTRRKVQCKIKVLCVSSLLGPYNKAVCSEVFSIIDHSIQGSCLVNRCVVMPPPSNPFCIAAGSPPPPSPPVNPMLVAESQTVTESASPETGEADAVSRPVGGAEGNGAGAGVAAPSADTDDDGVPFPRARMKVPDWG